MKKMLKERSAQALALLIPLVLLCSCATAAYEYSEDMSFPHLGEKEGIAVFRIHNPNAGMEGWYYREAFGSAVGSGHLLSLHSDFVLARRGMLFYSSFFTVRNAEAEQVVCMVLPEGTYRIDKIGRNSHFDSPGRGEYLFTVEPGCINYIGDFYLTLYLGTSSSSVFPILSDLAKGVDTSLYDFYTLDVTDSFQETADAALLLHPALSLHDLRNSCAAPVHIRPSACWGERAEVSMGKKTPVYQEEGIWYFTLEPL